MLKKTKQQLQNAVQPSKEHIASLWQDVRSKIHALKADRSADEQTVLSEDFAKVLAAWGIHESQIPSVLTALKLRLVVFAVPVLLAVVLAQFKVGLVILIGILCCLAVSIVGLATTLWRIYVLTFREFVPFQKWLFSIFSQKNS